MVTLKLKGPKRPEADPPKQLIMGVAREDRGFRKSEVYSHPAETARCPPRKSTDKSGLAVSTSDAPLGAVPIQHDPASPLGDTIRVHDPRVLPVRPDTTDVSADIDPLYLHEKVETSAAEQTDSLSKLRTNPDHKNTEQCLPAKLVHNPVKV